MSGTEKAMQGVADTLREFWAHRPVRPRAGRKAGGVATGIALRFQIDPVIVRIAFVALALSGGVGVPLYLAGWLLLPEEGDEVSPLESLINKGHSSMPQAQTVLLGFLMFPALAFTVGSGGFQVVVTLAAAVACVYLLQKNRGHLQPATTLSDSVTPVTPPVPGAPAWDPLGAAPFAWDLPEPTPKPQPPAPRPPRGPRIGLMTLGVATLVVAGSAIAGAWAPWFTVPHVIGLVLAVLAAGLLLGSFTGGGRGLIWLMIPLSVVGFGMTAIDFDGSPSKLSSYDEKPKSVTDVRDRYETSVGSVQLDLRDLPDSGSVKTAIEVELGEVQVRVPKNADVTYRCEASSIGELDCLGKRAEGSSVDVSGRDLGENGEGGLQIELDVQASVGEVKVLRD
ncbi:PspC domain-containing protein [Lentzea sp. BCCO 10_0061]|uniref:PspC domain-containing protein n=1 Tax=Lentzea sokolovensis TaxID=3095429 RepID=A0ABU4UT46_9PSEU|nr:PspC domain-containing protein [Lentzea sp. BCCO 10_0061]MDX8142664.1 PspC domain-containing protein [Lentzea sp. BCCO 10_0061]